MHSNLLAVGFALLPSLANLAGAAPSPAHWSYPTLSAPAVPGGPNVTVTGTVNEFVAALKKANPNWTPETSEVDTIVARSTKPPSRINCDASTWGYVPFANASTGCQSLVGIQGADVIGAGPGNCHTFYCSGTTSIGWCNDNKFTKSVNWSDLYTRCRYTEDNCNDENGQAAGQTFYPDNTNLIIRSAPCRGQ